MVLCCGFCVGEYLPQKMVLVQVYKLADFLVRTETATALFPWPFLSSAENFSNSLDPNQDRQKVGSDLDPKCLTL